MRDMNEFKHGEPEWGQRGKVTSSRDVSGRA